MYLAASSSAPRVLSFVLRAIRYSFSARSRWLVASKILPRSTCAHTSVHRGWRSPFQRFAKFVGCALVVVLQKVDFGNSEVGERTIPIRFERFLTLVEGIAIAALAEAKPNG
jgi:hypothetical protein